MKKKIVYIVITLALLVFLVWLSYYYVNKNHYYDQQGVRPFEFRGTEDLTFSYDEPLFIEQEILSPNPNLSKIQIGVRSNNTSILSLQLVQKDNQKIVATNNIATAPNKNPHYIIWEFIPVPDSQNKKYILSATLTENTDSLVILTVPSNKLPEHKLFINGQESDQRLVLNYSYYTLNPVKLILQRLPYAKPGVFNYRVTFLILFIIFCLLWFVLIWFLVKIFLFSKEEDQ